MNPLTNVRNLAKLNDRELELGVVGSSRSWHEEFRNSAWIFVGGLPYDLSEGDIITVFSQYGEVVQLNLIRDKTSGKSKGYGFLCYEDQRSSVLAVDNFNGAKLLQRTIRVDHVANYRPPKEHGGEDDETKNLRQFGCGPNTKNTLEDSSGAESDQKKKKEKKDKKKRKKHKKEKHSPKPQSEETSLDNSSKRRKLEGQNRDLSSSDEPPYTSKQNSSKGFEQVKDRNGNPRIKREKLSPPSERVTSETKSHKRELSSERRNYREVSFSASRRDNKKSYSKASDNTRRKDYH